MALSNRLVVSVACLASLAVSGFAQKPSSNSGQDVIKPFRQIRTSAATTDSTYDFFPAINPGYSLRFINPNHETGWVPLKGEPNSLPVGENTNVQNVTPGTKWPAISATGWTPPDPDLGVGPTHVVVVVNSSIAFFTKSGQKVFEQTFGNFFSSVPGVTNFLFDPKCFYDTISKRFMVICLEQADNNRISKGLVAVSDDSNPIGTWHKYRVELKQTVSGADFWLDYPGWGYNKDAVVITGNMFGFAGGYNGIQYAVLPKAPMLTGAALTVSYLSSPGSTVHPMRSFDATTDKIFMGTVESSSSIKLGVLTNLLTTPTLTTSVVTVPSFEFPGNSESTAGHQLDAIGGRMMNAFFRGGKLVLAHTVRPSGGQPNAARWYEFNVGTWPTSGNPTLAQAGNVLGSSGQHFSMPAVTSNSKGDIAMVFARSSSQICMDFMGAGRKRTDLPGTMGAAKLLGTSIGATYGGSGGNRFGDYFGAAVDPSDDTTFWGVGMVAASNGDWLTVVNNFQISAPSGGGSTTSTYPPTSISMVQGTSSFGTLADVLKSDNRYFTIGSEFADRVGQVAASEATFTVTKPGSQFTSLGLNAENSGATGVTTSVFIWNWADGKYVYIGAFPSGVSDTLKSINILAGFSSYISSSRQVKVMLRAVSPQTVGRSPIPFNYRLDLLQLKGD